MRLFEMIAQTCGARHRCLKNGAEFAHKHDATLDAIEADWLPSGSGIDTGTSIDRDASNDERIVLNTSYHHMNDNGFYNGWTDHKITLKPSFIDGFSIKISGRNRNFIKDYLGDLFAEALRKECSYEDFRED